MVERKYVLRSRRVLILLSHSQLVTGNTAEMRKIVATLLKNSSSHSLRVAVMVQGLSSVSLDELVPDCRIPDCRIPYCRFHFAESHIADFC
jgi:hypothetical protein